MLDKILSIKHCLVFFFLVDFVLVFGGGFLVLLVFGNEVVHVRFSFSEFHLVHTFGGVPVKESLSSKHSSELFTNSLEHLLNGGGVTDEGNGHLQTSWWDITDGGLDVIWDPFDEVRRVLVLDVQHLFVNFFGGHSSSELGGGGEVSSVSWVRSTHHVLGVEHLLGEFWDREGSVLLGSSGGEWGETNHEEVKSWEWYQVSGELSEIRVQLTWESERASDTRHSGGNQVVKISVGWGGELEGSEADVIKGFVINDLDFIGVFDQLMDGKGGVIWFDNGVRNLWGWEYGESFHDSVWVFFSDLGDQKSSHTGSGTTTEGVANLESLETVTSFSFLSDDVEDGVDEFSTFGVVTLAQLLPAPVCPKTKLSGLKS